MKKIQKWRYYCDYCKKSGASGGAMAKHEKHCSMNPTRECRMCALAGDVIQSPIDTLIAAAREGLEALRTAANGCPACMLSGIRQLHAIEKQEPEYKIDGPTWFEWSFKDEATAWLAQCAQNRREAGW